MKHTAVFRPPEKIETLCFLTLRLGPLDQMVKRQMETRELKYREQFDDGEEKGVNY